METHHGDQAHTSPTPGAIRSGLLIRQLTKSDLGLFYAKRREIQSKQRALNINAAIISRILPPALITAGEVSVLCERSDARGASPELRPLYRSGKNWRLGGNAVRDEDLATVAPGDFFIGDFTPDEDGKPKLRWRILSRQSRDGLHARFASRLSSLLQDAMAFITPGDDLYSELHPVALSEVAADAESSASAPVAPSPQIAPPPRPISAAEQQPRRRRTIKERVRSPHIMEEMLQVAGGLSGPVQQEFFDAVVQLAEMLREILAEHSQILQVPRDHSGAWAAVRGKLIAHVDGGVANMPALGAAPVAIRVGTYMVRPGTRDDTREHFSIRPQLVDELFATSAGHGIFNGLYPDMGAVRDAARMATEAAGAVEVIEQHPEVGYVLMHGALVNPVSRYSDMDDEEGHTVPFPEFSDRALQLLLPFKNPKPTGDQAQFIPVYLQQMLRLEAARATVCGVVERPGHSVSVSAALLAAIPDHELAPHVAEPPPKWREWFQQRMKQLGIGDTLLFRCVLEEGEATVPVPVDRNELRRAPPKWRSRIAEYPKPFVSYMLPSEWAGPIRVEIFEKSLKQYPEIARFLMHSSMLLPGYAFPVGLDTADKFAKIPNWMGRPVTARMMVSAFKRALDSGNARQIDALRHLLCGTERDFFFRPKP